MLVRSCVCLIVCSVFDYLFCLFVRSVRSLVRSFVCLFLDCLFECWFVYLCV